ncbi:MAG: hypothetical protein AB1813_08860 [Verrucomicrobiota bacterium]
MKCFLWLIGMVLVFRAGIFHLAAQSNVSQNSGLSAGLDPAVLITNPYGVMLGGGGTDADRIALAKTLGVAYYRPLAVFLDKGGNCVDCDVFTNAGFKLVLVVRANGELQSPSHLPTDLNKYKEDLRRVLELFRPALLVVENEVNGVEHFWNDTPENYLLELKAGCDVAHQLGIPCTDSGMTAGGGTTVAAIRYFYNNGAKDKALELAQNTGTGVGTMEDLDRFISQMPRENIFVEVVFAGLKAAGADYINFHWYLPSIRALELTVEYLRTFGLPITTDEIGQWNDDPEETEWKLRTSSRLGVAPIVWFSIDTARARALHSEGTLRATGERFRSIVVPLKIAGVEANTIAGDITIRWEGPGTVFQVERALAITGPFQPVGSPQAERTFTDRAVLKEHGRMFYRVVSNAAF